LKRDWQTILLGAMLAALLAACSSTASHTDSTSGNTATTGSSAASGSSGTSGSTSSSSSDDTDTHGNNTRLTPPPVASPSSTGTVIDDRINNNTDVPGQSR
jgi:uncharacterized protein YceK